MTQVHWNALLGGNWPDPGKAVMEGFDRGRKLREQADLRKAIAAAQRGDPQALSTVMQLNPQLGIALEDQLYQRGERQRATESRAGKAALMLGPPNALTAPQGPVNALMSPPSLPGSPIANGLTQPAPEGPRPLNDPGGSTYGRPQRYSPEIEQAIRADPEGLLKFQGQRLEVTEKQLKAYRDLNNAAMQLLGGVYDQATYDAAKQRALQLYSQHGHDASEFITGLPAEYSPETVRMLQMQGMDTSRQLQAIARENRLEWDIEDDQLDNERADRNTDSLVNDRRERLKDARNRPRPGSRPDGKPKSANALYADIMRRWTAGESLNGREREFVRSYEARQNKGGRRSRAQSSGGRVATAVGPNGQRIVVRNGKWVDAQTGKPVQ